MLVKMCKKMIFALVIVMLIAAGIIGCAQEGIPDPPKEQGDAAGDENVFDGKSPQGKDQGKKQDEEESPEADDKLVPNPSVDIREGMDYLVIDVPAEDFELEDLQGNTVKLSDYEGQIIFLNFWATWCPPCREEMPDMEKIHKEYGDRGVVILTVNSTSMELRGGSDSNKAGQQVEEFINDNGYTFPVLLDSEDGVLMKYNDIYTISGIPTTFMIDKEGQIRYAKPGAFTGKEQMEAFVALLEE